MTLPQEEEQEKDFVPIPRSESLFNVLDVMSTAAAVIEYSAPLTSLQRIGLVQILDDALITVRRVTQEYMRKETLSSLSDLEQEKQKPPFVAQTDNPHMIAIERSLFESMMSALHVIQMIVKDHHHKIAEKGFFPGRINESVRYLRHLEECAREGITLNSDGRLSEKVDALIKLLHDMDGLLYRYKDAADSIHLGEDLS